MNYPSDFQTPAVPSGRATAVARVMAIWSGIAFLIIVFLCGILLWSARSQKMTPFLISVDNTSGEWRAHGAHTGRIESSINQTMQESAVINFTRNWFTISANSDMNDAAWKQCARAECQTGNSVMFGPRNCAISCSAGDDVYQRFAAAPLADLRARAKTGETWRIDTDGIAATPRGPITRDGGVWDITATVISSVMGELQIRAIVSVARNENYYPLTAGFYIADFNAYRVETGDR
jgi:hypothetical protein